METSKLISGFNPEIRKVTETAASGTGELLKEKINEEYLQPAFSFTSRIWNLLKLQFEKDGWCSFLTSGEVIFFIFLLATLIGLILFLNGNTKHKNKSLRNKYLVGFMDLFIIKSLVFHLISLPYYMFTRKSFLGTSMFENYFISVFTFETILMIYALMINILRGKENVTDRLIDLVILFMIPTVFIFFPLGFFVSFYLHEFQKYFYLVCLMVFSIFLRSEVDDSKSSYKFGRKNVFPFDVYE